MGELGDSVTVLPLVVALGALTPVSLAHVLVGFGVFRIVWGVRYGLPVSVEPMKALVGLAIAGALSYGELVAAGLLAGGVPAPAVPGLALFPAGVPSFTVGAVEGTVAQLTMTVGNAAIATSLLFGDLFDTDVSPDRLSTSMGTMTLAAVPLGGLPMCHGSGGLAGKYAFGARTGGANVVLGVLYFGAALVAGVWLQFPMALLGALVGAVALQLAVVAFDTDRPALVAAVGLLALATNVGIAFLAGLAYWLARERWASVKRYAVD